MKLRDPQAAVQTVRQVNPVTVLRCTYLEGLGTWLSPCDQALTLSPGCRNWGSILSPWAPSLFYWLPSSSRSRVLPRIITPTPDSSQPDHLSPRDTAAPEVQAARAATPSPLLPDRSGSHLQPLHLVCSGHVSAPKSRQDREAGQRARPEWEVRGNKTSGGSRPALPKGNLASGT